MSTAVLVLRLLLVLLLLGGYVFGSWRDFVGDVRKRDWFGASLLFLAFAMLTYIAGYLGIKIWSGSENLLRPPDAWRFGGSVVFTAMLVYAVVRRARFFKKDRESRHLAAAAWLSTMTACLWALFLVEFFATR